MGTSRMSSNIENVFKTVINQLKLILSITNDEFDKCFIEEFDERKKEYSNVKQLEVQLKVISDKLKENEKLIIFLDSIDQLNPDDFTLAWYFNNLPKRVKLIYSVIKDYKGIYAKLNTMVSNKNCFEIKNLNKIEAIERLFSLLGNIKRKITKSQREILDKLFLKIKDINALHLKLIFDIVSKWKSYDTIDDDFFECTTITETIIYLLKNIEKRFNKIVFKKCLFYLTYFENRGISESELEGILSIDNQVLDNVFEKDHPPIRKFPISIWYMYQYELNEYLTHKEIDNISVIAW